MLTSTAARTRLAESLLAAEMLALLEVVMVVLRSPLVLADPLLALGIAAAAAATCWPVVLLATLVVDLGSRTLRPPPLPAPAWTLAMLLLAFLAAVAVRQTYLIVDPSRLELPDRVRPVADVASLLVILGVAWLGVELARSRRVMRLVVDNASSRRMAATGAVLVLVTLALGAAHFGMDAAFDTHHNHILLTLLALPMALCGRWLLVASPPPRCVSSALALLVVLTVGMGALVNDAVRFAFIDRSPVMGRALQWASSALDFDGDGAPGFWPGGADCAPLDATRGPAVRDVPGDGIDQDCRGGDQTATPWPASSPGGPWSQCVADFRARVPHPNVFLITFDALRYDTFRRRAPASLVDFAARSAYFTDAYSASSRTEFAIPALLSGRYLSDVPEGNRPTEPATAHELPLVTALRANGYRAVAVSSLRAAWFAHNFDSYGGEGTDPPTTGGANFSYASGAFAQAAARHLARVDGHPLFLWLHQLDAHAPYIPIRRDSFPEPDADRYERAVTYTLVRTSSLLDHLAQSPRRDDTLIVVTADHGEERGERGRYGHGGDLVETAIRVPLIVHVPGCPGVVVSEPVTAVDLAPMLGALTGVWRAQWSLLDVIAGTPSPLPVVAEVPFGGRLERAVIGHHAKMRLEVGSGGRIVRHLPADVDDLAREDEPAPEARDELERAYDRWLGRQPSWQPL